MENKLYSAIYDSIMKGLTKGKVNPDEPAQIEAKIKVLRAAFEDMYYYEDIDEEMLLRDIISQYNIWIGTPPFLDNNKDHEEWIAAEKTNIKWNYWKRYSKYMEEIQKMPPQVVSNLEYTTEEILRRLESPRRQGNWDRRGMVVGNVQSGKTANYTGLICKAVDAGYKIIIVLAGLNNDLRSQTQKRIDAGFLGKDTAKKTKREQGIAIGAGTLPGFEVDPVIAVTSSDANGDYKTKVHNAITITPGGDPVIAVVKKNTTPLKNLLNWFENTNSGNKIENVPLLLIDDEADNGSINVKAIKKIGRANSAKESETDPTKINGYIRKILNIFGQSAYVGYTATPFANIFIYPDENEGSEFGEDLYPRSFIANLHAPSNYMGPEAVFGLYKDRTAGIDAKEPLPLIRPIDDYEEYFPEKHKKDLIVTGLPDTLYRALYAFILSCAARTVRGQGEKHKSMLVHITRYVDVQEQIVDYLRTAFRKIVSQLAMKTGPKYEKLISDLRYMWSSDFEKTTKETKENWDDDCITDVTWQDIEPQLYLCASKIEVKAINGRAADGGLKYEEYPHGANIIAVGGDKLSRGLTLEGLAVSYYTRTSKMYDTLLQMGRWFGYRPGYVDLCRLYTSTQLVKWYQHIAVANEELRRELDDMAEMGATPESYGLKVRTHPEGMLITAMNKMRNSQLRKVTYAGKLVQITSYFKENNINKKNLKFLDNWILKLGERAKEEAGYQYGCNYVWNNVEPSTIFDFMNNIAVHPTCVNASPKIVMRYIDNQNHDNELTKWTVALINLQNSKYEPQEVGGLQVNMPWRTDSSVEDTDVFTVIRSNLITESDQQIDLNQQQKDKAKADTINHFQPTPKRQDPPEEASPIWIRRNRPKTNALLLVYVFTGGKKDGSRYYRYSDTYVGYAISFPDSNTAKEVEYKVDEVYVQNESDEEYD